MSYYSLSIAADMLAEEFREAARKLWACAPAARWDVELGLTTPSSGASAVADQLLRPLQVTPPPPSPSSHPEGVNPSKGARSRDRMSSTPSKALLPNT